jgi:hypothetical protein
MKLSDLQFIPIALVALLFTMPAAAEGEYEKFNDRFRVYVGAYYPTADTRVAVYPGGEIDVENVLRVDKAKTVAWGGIRWRISRRNSLEFEHFSLERDGDAAGDFNPVIQIGRTYLESGAITTSYDTAISRLTYGFSVVRSDRADLQFKAGLHIADIDIAFALVGNICSPDTDPTEPPNCPLSAQKASIEDQDVTAPLPHLGVSFKYAITPSVVFKVEGIGFAIELDSVEGSVVELDADIAWQPWRHVGFGAGVRYFNVNAKARTADLDGEFDIQYLGPTLYVQATF